MNQWQAVNSRPRDQETTGLDRDEDENAIALITFLLRYMFRAFFMGLLSQKQWWKLFLTRLNRFYNRYTEQHQWQYALFALLELILLNWVAPIKPTSSLFTKPHSLRASSPVWASEACLTRTQAILGELCGGTKYELPLKRLRGRLSFPLPLAASPLARAFSQD